MYDLEPDEVSPHCQNCFEWKGLDDNCHIRPCPHYDELIKLFFNE